MLLGTTFAEVVALARSEAGRSAEPAAGQGDRDTVRAKVNSVYQMLVADYDWPHLITYFPRIRMSPGVRFYALPDGLDIHRIEFAAFWWSGEARGAERGIGFNEYTEYDPESDARSDPPLRYDFRDDGEEIAQPQIEVWPLPASDAAELQFAGFRRCPPLVEDADRLLIDSIAVQLTVAAELLSSTDDASAKRVDARARARIQQIRAGIADPDPVRLGLGSSGRRSPHDGVSVHVGRKK